MRGSRSKSGDLHRIFEFQRDIWRSYGQISIKFNGSIAAVAWTNWLGFQLDRDNSPGSGFTPDFWILAGYLYKLWTDFDEILWVDSCGVCTIWLHFEPDVAQSPDLGSGHVFKIARRIILKVMDGFQWNFMNEQRVNHGRLRLISEAIQIIFGMRYSYSDFTQIIDYGSFWRNLVQRWRLRQGRAE